MRVAFSMNQNRLFAAALIAAIAAAAAITTAAAAFAGLGFYLWPVAKRIEKTSAILLDCKGNPACLPSQALAITGSVRSIAGSVTKAMPEITAAAKIASEQSANASRQAAIAAEETAGLVKDARAATQQLTADLVALHALITGLDAGAKTLLASADTTVKAAGAALVELAALEKELSKAIQEGSPKALEIANAMLAILNDASIRDTLANVEAATGSGAEILDTVDQATRGLREKIGRVKWLLNRIVGIVKVTAPLPF